MSKMNLWSISFAYRLGLGFHALNNEGADGSNLMQPRRIDVGNITYDGISGEIIRRHILEHFVNVCREEKIPMFTLSEHLHPDRGPIGIRAAAKKLQHNELNDTVLYPSVRNAIISCAVLDIGGYLAAWKEGKERDYIAEKPYLDSNCASRGQAEPVKRESCFDVAWLISENPQNLTITQHSTFRDTSGENDRYSQTMRSNIYSGIIRADLHRIGMDDYWYLQNGANRLAIDPKEQKKRQVALIQAIANFIASPSGAKTAGWAPHVFLTEGAILLTSSRTAPFCSPIKVSLNDTNTPVSADLGYADSMKKLENKKDTWVWTFKDISDLIEAAQKAIGTLSGTANANEKTD